MQKNIAFSIMMVLTTCVAFVLGAEFQKQKDVQVMKDSTKEVPSSVTAEDNTRTNNISVTQTEPSPEIEKLCIDSRKLKMMGMDVKWMIMGLMGQSKNPEKDQRDLDAMLKYCPDVLE